MKKHLCPQGKGKIHPSPAPPLVEGSSSCDALAVLELLPAAILALAAALTCEDKEVLAYLIMHSIHGPAEEVMPQATASSAHRPLLGCGCFDCYTSFWSRWDSSPHRDLIHRAIEAFEEQLASSEKTGGGGGKGRRREKSDEVEEIESEVVIENEEEEEEWVKASVVASEAATFSVEMNEAVDATTAEVGRGEEMAAALAGERRRFWPGVMGLINCRLWSLWSPAV